MEGLQGGTRASARRALKFVVLTVCAALSLALVSGPASAKKPAKKKPNAPKVTFTTPVTPGSAISPSATRSRSDTKSSRSFRPPNYADASS